MARFTNTHFGLRDLDKEHHWNGDVDDFSITKTTFINFGGNGTIDEIQANGRCSRVERMMGLKAKKEYISSTYQDIDILACVYGRDLESQTVGNLTKEEVSQFSNKFLLPLFVNEKGERLTVEQASINFSKVVFYSHCYGSQVINEVMADLCKKLQNLGYSRNEVDDIYSQTIHITYSPLQSDSWLPSVSVNSLTDSFNYQNGMHVWFKRKFGYDLNGIALDYDVKSFCNHINEKKNCHKNISIFTSRLLNLETNTGSRVIDEHASDYLDLDFNWNACEKAMGAKNAECVSRLIGYAMSWAGARSLKIQRTKKLIPLNLQDLYDGVEDVLKLYNSDELSYQ